LMDLIALPQHLLERKEEISALGVRCLIFIGLVS